MLVLKINDRIRNRKVEHFNSFDINLAFDAVGSTFAFDFYFEPNNNDHKELLCIGHYHIATLEYNDKLILTGNIVSQKFNSKSARQYVSLGGYSTGGILEDCNIPTSAYPLQNDGLTIAQIVSKLLQPFGIRHHIDSLVGSEMNTAIATTTASESQTVKAYIAQLCAQKNVIISHNEKGDILFTRLNTKQQPIFEIDTTKQRSYPATSFSLSYDGQGFHSHITAFMQADGENAGESTIRNPFVINSVFRPRTVVQSSGDDNDTAKVARQALAQELNGLQLTMELSTWDIDGQLIKPGMLVSVLNPEIYLYKKQTWVISSVSLKGDNKATTSSITCVLPEVYTNKTPEYIWKGINLH